MKENDHDNSLRGIIDLLIGLFWGDEGKGKAILDLLVRYKYEVSARYQGGPNAGHTLYVNGEKFVAHMLPSGVAVPGVRQLLIGNDAVIDPIRLVEEIQEAEALGMSVISRLKISGLATIITPYHKLLDGAAEWLKNRSGAEKIGTTKSGIGPSYADAASRDALKMCMIGRDDFAGTFQAAASRHAIFLKAYATEGMVQENSVLLAAEMEKFMAAVRWISENVAVVDMNKEVEAILSRNQNILAEGAQGVMLDIGFGDYPFTTSSVTTAQGVFHGLGIGPQDFGTLYGVMKPYVTKVGGGSFPSRMEPEMEKYFQEEGEEIGATTGRKRMCGYLDLVALRYAVGLHRGFGTMKIFITKTDVFPEEVETTRIVTHYRYSDGSISRELKFPLSDVVGVLPEEDAILPWKVTSGQRAFVENLNFDTIVSRIRLALSGLPAEVAFIGTGCNIGDCFEYPPEK